MSFSLSKDISLSETAAVGLSYTFSILRKKNELRIFYILCLALCWLCWSLVVWGVMAESRRVSVNTHTHTHTHTHTQGRDVSATAEMALYFWERCKQHFSEQPRTALIRATLTSDNMAKPEWKSLLIYLYIIHLCIWQTLLSEVTNIAQVNRYIIHQCMHSLGIEPMTLVLLAPCSTVYIHSRSGGIFRKYAVAISNLRRNLNICL